jgi:hypothetical protein
MEGKHLQIYMETRSSVLLSFLLIIDFARSSGRWRQKVSSFHRLFRGRKWGNKGCLPGPVQNPSIERYGPWPFSQACQYNE